MRMTAPIWNRSLDDLLGEAVAFHGHTCPGQVLGVRMTMAGCRAVGVPDPRAVGKALVIFVEIDRCATDAIQALTGASLGKRTLKHLDFGKTAATFVNRVTGAAVRVVAREDARAAACRIMPGMAPRSAQETAYRLMPDADLLVLEAVSIADGWLDRARVRVACEACREGVNYRREVRVDGRVLCRACAGDAYYAYDAAHNALARGAGTL
jgi:formylmethanofuran dehydrogenase subunit E